MLIINRMERDFVDAAVDGWARQWPGLETSALEVTARLDRIARHLERRVAGALNVSGVSGRDLDVLGALRRSGTDSGLPASQLARAAMITSGGMTGQADRLASAGLVVRRPDPRDRRAVLVTLTPQGSGVVEQALKAYLRTSKKVLSVLEQEEKKILAGLLRKLLVELEADEDAGGPMENRNQVSNARLTGRPRSKPPPAPRTFGA